MSRLPALGATGSGLRRRLRKLWQWWLDRSVPVKGLVALAIPMLALISVTGSAFVLQLEQRSERQGATAANLVLGSSSSVLRAITDAETGIRGYAATGDTAFLEAYDRGLERLRKTIAGARIGGGIGRRTGGSGRPSLRP